jgi:hypothetical protein
MRLRPSRYTNLAKANLSRDAEYRQPGLKAAIRCNLDELPFSPKSAVSQKLCKDQRQGLLCLIATVETQDYGPGTPDHGRHASDTGPLVLGSWIHLGLVLFATTN